MRDKKEIKPTASSVLVLNANVTTPLGKNARLIMHALQLLYFSETWFRKMRPNKTWHQKNILKQKSLVLCFTSN